MRVYSYCLPILVSWVVDASLSFDHSQQRSRSNVPSGLDLVEEGTVYRFERFIVDFDRNYPTEDEYNKRKVIFESNLQTIVEHNLKYIMDQKHHGDESSLSNFNVDNIANSPIDEHCDNRKSLTSTRPKTTYLMGINHLMDHLPEELPLGYNSLQSSRVRNIHHRFPLSWNDKLRKGYTSLTSALRSRRVLLDQQQSEQKLLDALGGEYWSLDKLPKSVDWRTKGVTTPVKNQGGCGSCWAFASTAVLESHIAIQTGVLLELSEQQFVSCAVNPHHCGGSGGCAGATAEIAYDHVMEHGIVEEWQFGYREYTGEPVNCTLTPKQSQISNEFSSTSSSTSLLRRLNSGDIYDTNSSYYKGAVATIEDFAILPSNNYLALLNVVARMGPVAVSVACLPWRFYQSGVFHAPLEPGKATDIDHLVVLEGYGTDEESGQNYWLVRNSWSPFWGEGGYIRLLRVGDTECSIDETPGDGDACVIDDNGNPIEPEPQTICGNSGILFDSVIPLGGSLLSKR
jgi:cathepsin L